jgi:N,N-dimethylformamidase
MHGHLLNAPKRAVRGMRWSGSRFDWTSCPEEYAAIHFHDDDLDDARWMPSLSLQIPADLASGAYALRVRRDGETLLLPLFVRSAEPGRRARVAVVFPTFTYLAYSNDHTLLHGNNAEVLAARAIALEPRDVAMARHPEWGLSLYDTHRDGSGVSVASRRRPVLTFAPDQRAWQGAEGSGRWNYSADLVMVEWLHREGIAWEALTDEDIDREGERLLCAYDVVLTGSHPEYTTPNMLAAYRAFAAGRGRLMYLGGNGFYWKVATDPAHPGLIELRRAEDGNRSWAEEPCEYYHQLDGQYGGLWRRSGVAPQSWLGVGYSGQGFRRSVGYRRGGDGERAEVAFVFEGVAGPDFGTRGAFGGGCAGIEIDRADELLGSPREGYVLASSHPFDDTYFMANEELLVTRPTVSGDYSSTVRSDLFLLATEGGGAVFSVGSVAWIGGLSANSGDADVIRITRNVLDRFLDPKPLPVRDGPYEY